MIDPTTAGPIHLTNILKLNGPLEPEELWVASRLSIDDFYDILAVEVANGSLREIRTGELDERVLLEAVE